MKAINSTYKTPGDENYKVWYKKNALNRNNNSIDKFIRLMNLNT